MILYVILAGCFLKEKVQTPEINACFSYIYIIRVFPLSFWLLFYANQVVSFKLAIGKSAKFKKMGCPFFIPHLNFILISFFHSLEH